MKDERQYYDKNGIPIYPGDLIRTFHYRGKRRRIFYLYHTVILREGYLEMVPTCHLEPTKAKSGGRCWLKALDADQLEVIYGYGPGPMDDFTDRPKVKERSS
jgi:hypothetical protein